MKQLVCPNGVLALNFVVCPRMKKWRLNKAGLLATIVAWLLALSLLYIVILKAKLLFH